jgi:uncharacterized cupredoxin-like copper-binding protein
MRNMLNGFRGRAGALSRAWRRRRGAGGGGTLACAVRWLAFGIAALGVGKVAHALGDLTAQHPVELRVDLGTAQNGMRFVPDVLYLETGRLFRLVLRNPSPQKHYFSSDALAQAVVTRKVQVNGRDGRPIAEVKGHIREIEVHPQGTSEWWFVPVKAGEFTDLRCTLPGHSEAGMIGKIIIR